MELRRVRTDEDAAAWHAVQAAACDADYVALPADPVGEAMPLVTADGSTGTRYELLLGVEDGAAVSAARLALPTRDNLDQVDVDLSVHPAQRRRGHARATWTAVAAHSIALGRSTATTEVGGRLDGAPTPGEICAGRLGFTRRLTEVRRVLDVDAVDGAALDRLAASARGHAAGYTLVSWVDRSPPAHHDGLAAMAGRMSVDTPRGDLVWEPEVWDAARWRARERANAEKGRRWLGTLVLSGDEVVAYSDVTINLALPEVGYQCDTIVRTDHRGHRLGMLLKIANTRLLRTHAAGTRWVNTWNAAVNGHMIAINEAVGFRPVDTWAEWQRTL